MERAKLRSSLTGVLRVTLPFVGIVMAIVVGPRAGHGATLTVTKTTDDVGPCLPGDCSLRAAVAAANANPGPDTIVFADLPGSPDTYPLTLAGAGENLGATGDLDSTEGDLTIVGNGQNETVIDGNGIDRVFHVLAGSFALHDAQLTGGLDVGTDALTDGGGGILCSIGSVRCDIVDSTLYSNRASLGGGAARFNAPSSVVRSIVDSNTATANSGGGLLYDKISTHRIEESTIRGNNATTFDGGGIASVAIGGGSGPNLEIHRSAIIENTAAGGGAGILVNAGLTEVFNSTISGNTTPATGGGGVVVQFAASLSLTNCTVANNAALHPSAGQGGGLAVGHATSSATLTNTIIADNVPIDCSAFSSPVISSGTNVVEQALVCFGLVAGDVTGVDAGLLPLALNGGPTLNHALACGSPAIDLGTAVLATDQRGQSRPVDGDGVDPNADSDAGSFEKQALGSSPDDAPCCGNGVVDGPEQCDSGALNGDASACCSATCGFKSAGTVCRTGAGDICDPDETCSGSSDACPADSVAPADTVCRPGSGDACDPEERCSGVAGSGCPADVFASSATVCRTGSGDLCDPDETCPGVAGEACPANAVADPVGSSLPLPAEGATGLATDPTTGSMYASVTVSAGIQLLAKVNPITGFVALAGFNLLPANLSGLAFTADGTLYAVADDAGSPANALYTIDKSSGSSTLLCTLGNGSDGEALAFNPADGLLYHATGAGSPPGEFFESITDTAGPVCQVSTIFAGDQAYGEIRGLTWWNARGAFVGVDRNSNDLYTLNPTGTVELGATLDHSASALAFNGGLYSVSGNDPNIRQINPNTGATLASVTMSFSNAGTVCRPGSGDMCDAEEICTGVPGAACPGDVIASVGTVCRSGSGDSCDPDEACSGAPGAACPSDVVATAGTVCRSGSGDSCDADEACSGVPGAACPSDVVASAGTVCRSGSGDSCDPDELCPGVPGAVCPTDVVASAGTVCRPGSGDICDPGEACTGVSAEACPADVALPTGTACFDGDDCTTGDACNASSLCAGVPSETETCGLCSNGVDDDLDSLTDAADPDCASNPHAIWAVEGLSTRSRGLFSVYLGRGSRRGPSMVQVSAVEGYDGGSRDSLAGVCANTMRLEGANIEGPTALFGTLLSRQEKGGVGARFENESGASGIVADADVVPYVGGTPALCTDGATPCATDASCPGEETCDRPSVLDAGADVDLSGGGTLLAQCGTALASAPADSDALGALAPTRGLGRLRIARGEVHTEVFAAGIHVVELTSLALATDATLVLEGAADSSIVFNVERALRLGRGAQIVLSGTLRPHQVMWNVRGSRGGVRLLGGSRFAGTLFAPGRRQVGVGGGVVVDGALIGQRVVIENGSVIHHHPFSMIPLP